MAKVLCRTLFEYQPDPAPSRRPPCVPGKNREAKTAETIEHELRQWRKLYLFLVATLLSNLVLCLVGIWYLAYFNQRAAEPNGCVIILITIAVSALHIACIRIKTQVIATAQQRRDDHEVYEQFLQNYS